MVEIITNHATPHLNMLSQHWLKIGRHDLGSDPTKCLKLLMEDKRINSHAFENFEAGNYVL